MMSERDFNEISQEWLDKVEELADIHVKITSADEYNAVRYLFSNKYLNDELKSWLKNFKRKFYKKKSESLADKYKLEGNKYYNIKNYHQALLYYNACLENAPRSSTTFAYGLSNRVSVFMQIGEYENANKDLNLLFTLMTYPTEKLHKLYLKQAENFIFLGEFEKGRKAYDRAIECLCSQPKRSQIDIDIIKNKLKNLNSQINGEIYRNDKQISILPKLENESRFLPGASSKLSLRYTIDKGRHIVAKVDIKKGDLLFVENPFAFIPIVEETKVTKMCNNCGIVSKYTIVCDECCNTHYCSEECRIEAWEKFHRWECEGSKMSIWFIIGIAHLTFRLVLVAFENQLEMFSGKNYAGILTNMENAEHFNIKYSRVFHLISNHDKIPERDWKKYAITSIMLTIYLKHYTDFFEVLLKKLNCNIPIEETELLISCLLCKHLLQMICNASLITSKLENLNIAGVGIYSSSSMMNHSCMPNTSNRYDGNVFIARASRNIEAGSEVFNCYGPQMNNGSRDDRRALLKEQYNFDCKCESCLNGL